MSNHAHIRVCGVVLLMLTVANGCERRGPVREARGPAAAPAQDTVRNASQLRQSDTLAVPAIAELKAVRIADRAEAERVVFEFQGALPEYRVAWGGLPPEQCGSGQAVAMEGDTAIVVRFTGGQAHNQAGTVGITSVINYHGDNIKQLRQICDFEGVVEWVIGLAHRTSFEVHELAAPARLVVDVRKSL